MKIDQKSRTRKHICKYTITTATSIRMYKVEHYVSSEWRKKRPNNSCIQLPNVLLSCYRLKSFGWLVADAKEYYNKTKKTLRQIRTHNQW